MTAVVSSLATSTKTSVRAVCETMGIPRSTVYAYKNKGTGVRARETVRLDIEVKATYAEYRGRYGSPRIHQHLKRRGIRVGRKRVEARMRILGLIARRPKRFCRTTEADPKKVPAPNTLDREFWRSLPDEAWVGDVTYLWTQLGWVYLAILIDLCTRGIVGWAVSRNCDTALVLKALDAAVATRKPPRGLLHHTDRGSTYTAAPYQARLKACGMEISMSRKGNCWDNSVAESTIGTIKAELFNEEIPRDIYHVQEPLFPYIEGFYNRQRLHSSLGYISPREEENLVMRGLA